MTNFLGIDTQNDGSDRSRRTATPSDLSFDIVFLIDSSNSLGRRPFRQGLRALRKLTSRGRPTNRYAAVKFSSEAHVEFNFTSPSDAVERLRRVKHARNMTNTQAALRICREELLYNKDAGARPGSAKSVLIVTDGQSNVHRKKTLLEAFRLKFTGAQVFVVAVGGYIRGIMEVVGLASSTDAHLFRVADMGDLVGVVKLIPPWYALQHGSHGSWLEGMEAPDDSPN